MLDDTIPLTVNEWDEWGDPRGREDFDVMLAYSPVRQPAARGRPSRPAGHRGRARPAGHGARARQVGRGAARDATRRGRHAACSGSRPAPARTSGPSGRLGHLAYEAEVLRLGARPARRRRPTRRLGWRRGPPDLHRAPAGRDVRRPPRRRLDRRAARVRRVLPLRPLPRHGHRRAARPDRRLGDAGRPGPRHHHDPARHPGHVGHLPAARAARDHRGRASTR